MTRASTPTLLPLDTFAKLFSINPIHFAGAHSEDHWPFQGACEEVWTQYSWQSVQLVSREELASAIATAENDISRILGYSVAPRWYSEEFHAWPRAMVKERVRMDPPFKLDSGKIIAGGQRATSEIELSVIPVFTDATSDGFVETATVTVASSVIPSEVRVFFAGHGPDPTWEIRPARKRVASGADVVLTFDSWLFIDPDLWELPYSITEDTAIDVSTTVNYVSEVDVYRVYNDTSAESSRFYWQGYYSCSFCGGTGCPACSEYTQSGCTIISDPKLGIVRPVPGSYNNDTASWGLSTSAIPGIPTAAKFWYYAGAVSDYYSPTTSDEIMPRYLAETVATLAASRLDKPFCSCGNLQDTINKLRRDMVFGDRTGYTQLPDNSVVYSNPFGTRVGEVTAWRKVSNLIPDVVWSAGVL